jgi:hypothetical protein
MLPAWAITDFMSFFGISPLLFKTHKKENKYKYG